MSTFSSTARAGCLVERRAFLGAAAAAPVIACHPLWGEDAPSSRVNVGVIGCGSRGSGHARALARLPGVQVVAVCDVYAGKAEQTRDAVDRQGSAGVAKGSYAGCTATTDARELLAHPGLDAVVIASPENWHAVHMSMAARAGKDIYGEKSLTHTVAEGEALIETVRRHGCVFQAGTQQRSDATFRQACELARNGYLGTVHTVHVGVPGGKGRAKGGVWPAVPPPADLDYDMWLGPAAWKPYRDGLCSFQWYFVSDYCVGWIASWGVHHMDIALWGMPQLQQGRVRVEGTAEFFDGTADVSYAWDVNITTEQGLRLHFVDNSRSHGQGCRFIGDKGWVHVNRGRIQASDPALLKLEPRPADTRLQRSRNHHLDFIDSIRSRRDPVAPIEACHAATALTVVADIATRVGRPLVWDWRTGRFENCDLANRALSRTLRSPWCV